MIGVFDSGVGGLSVLRAIAARLPHEKLSYVADSAHAPYGERDAAFIEARALALAQGLVDQGARALVVACNTASVVAAARLRETFTLPIIAMEPAIKPAAALTNSGTVGVLATARTLQSDAVARLCSRFPAVRWKLQPCPGLVECIERGETDTPATAALLEGLVRPLLDAGADTLVLGCTHYPFIAPLLRRIAGPAVAIVDPSEAVARQVAARVPAGSLRARPVHCFASTGDAPHARRVMSQLWGRPVDVTLALP